MYFETEHCRAAPAVTAIVAGCCRDFLSYTVSEQMLLWLVIYFVNFQKFIQSVMSSVSAAVAVRCCCPPLLLSAASAIATSPVAVAIAVAARVLKHSR